MAARAGPGDSLAKVGRNTRESVQISVVEGFRLAAVERQDPRVSDQVGCQRMRSARGEALPDALLDAWLRAAGSADTRQLRNSSGATRNPANAGSSFGQLVLRFILGSSQVR